MNGLIECYKKTKRNLKMSKTRLKQKSATKKVMSRMRLQKNKAIKRETVKHIDFVFKNVLEQRYRDAYDIIRAESLLQLSHWVEESPDLFLKDEKLKYIGWMLNDSSDMVRKSCLDGLRKIYSKDKNLDKISQFTERFFPRMLEMIDDVNTNVAYSAIKLITIFYKKNLLEDTEDDSMVNLLFSKKPKIRRAAADFFEIESFKNGEDPQNEFKKLIKLFKRYELKPNEKLSHVSKVFIQNFVNRVEALKNWKSVKDIFLNILGNKTLLFNDDELTVFYYFVGSLAQIKERNNEFLNFVLSIYELMPDLLLNHKLDSEKLIPLFIVLRSLEYHQIDLHNDKHKLESLLNSVEVLFGFCSDEDVLMAISIILKDFTNQSFDFSIKFSDLVYRLFEDLKNSILAKIKDLDVNDKLCNESFSEELNLDLLKYQCLAKIHYIKFDDLIKKFHQYLLTFDKNSIKNETMIRSMLEISFLSVLWLYNDTTHNEMHKNSTKKENLKFLKIESGQKVEITSKNEIESLFLIIREFLKNPIDSYNTSLIQLQEISFYMYCDIMKMRLTENKYEATNELVKGYAMKRLKDVERMNDTDETENLEFLITIIIGTLKLVNYDPVENKILCVATLCELGKNKKVDEFIKKLIPEIFNRENLKTFFDIVLEVIEKSLESFSLKRISQISKMISTFNISFRSNAVFEMVKKGIDYIFEYYIEKKRNLDFVNLLFCWFKFLNRDHKQMLVEMMEERLDLMSNSGSEDEENIEKAKKLCLKIRRVFNLKEVCLLTQHTQKDEENNL